MHVVIEVGMCHFSLSVIAVIAINMIFVWQILLCTWTHADYDDTEYLPPVTAHVGQTVTLPCSTTVGDDVDWRQTSKLRGLYVYSNGVMYEDFRYRFYVDRSIPGFYNLTITNVQLNDSAQYICIEDTGQGREHYHTLNVTG